MIFHEKIGRWLQPGGHLEPSIDRSAEAGARRELLEEVTFKVQTPPIRLLVAGAFDFDIHTVGKGKCRDHYDFRFLYVCPRRAAPETDTQKWFKVSDLAKSDDESISRYCRKIMALNA